MENLFHFCLQNINPCYYLVFFYLSDLILIFIEARDFIEVAQLIFHFDDSKKAKDFILNSTLKCFFQF